MSTDRRSPDADRSERRLFTPSATPAAVFVGVVLGAALLALFAVVVRELVERTGLVSGSSWSHATSSWFADARWFTWSWVIAVALIVVGVALLVSAVKPRRRTHLRLAGHESLWTRAGDVARRCSAAVSEIPGVRNATTVVGRRRARITVIADEQVDRAELEREAARVLSVLERPPNPRVTVKTRRAEVTR